MLVTSVLTVRTSVPLVQVRNSEFIHSAQVGNRRFLQKTAGGQDSSVDELAAEDTTRQRGLESGEVHKLVLAVLSAVPTGWGNWGRREKGSTQRIAPGAAHLPPVTCIGNGLRSAAKAQGHSQCK